MGPFRTVSLAGLVVAFAATAAALVPSTALGADAAFPPTPASSGRSHAEAVLAGMTGAPGDSLSVTLARWLDGHDRSSAAALRAARTIRDGGLDGATTFALRSGAGALAVLDDPARGRIDPRDDDGDGLPDALAPAVRGFELARALLQDELGLAAPAAPTLAFARIAGGANGYAVAGSPGVGPRVVLDPDPPGGPDALLRASARETAFVTVFATHPGLDPAWADAFARWAALRVAPADDDVLASLALRRDRWHEGLGAGAPELAAGNALWFAWLDEAVGTRAVGIALEELARGVALDVALERVAERAAGLDLAAATRDFQTWALLTGSRDDGRHFSFGGRMPDPRFAADADWLPSISVQSDAPIAPLGGSAFRIAPERERGGMTVRFEGGFEAAWSADLLLRLEDGALHRVALRLEAGRGEVTVPLGGLEEAVLLVRNDSPAAGPAARFTWTAYAVRGFPFELTRVDATPQAAPPSGVLLSWETASETRLLGFNLLRTPAEGGATRRVNPVWIPAIGDPSEGASYRYLDAGAEPGRTYVYRLEGLTLEGLRSTADAVVAIAPERPR